MANYGADDWLRGGGGTLKDKGTVVVTCVGSSDQLERASLLVESLRSFGGRLAHSHVAAYAKGDVDESPRSRLDGLEVIPLNVPDALSSYPLADKVCACAEAEKDAGDRARSLVWLAPECLVVDEPSLLDLGDDFDVALRPVHIRNVGSLAAGPLDGYWKRIYDEVGMEDTGITVESFVDGQHIRAYYNTHVFSTRPSGGLFRRWLGTFDALVRDREFQRGACGDDLHKVFLHQAVLSALVSASVRPERIRALPPAYSYPYNLQSSIPSDRRAQWLDDLVCAVYEDRSIDPDSVDDIAIDEPLRSWLSARTKRVQMP